MENQKNKVTFYSTDDVNKKLKKMCIKEAMRSGKYNKSSVIREGINLLYKEREGK